MIFQIYKNAKLELGVTSKKNKSQSIPQTPIRNGPSIRIRVKTGFFDVWNWWGLIYFVILYDTVKLVTNFVTLNSSSHKCQIQLALEKSIHQDLNYLLTRIKGCYKRNNFITSSNIGRRKWIKKKSVQKNIMTQDLRGMWTI